MKGSISSSRTLLFTSTTSRLMPIHNEHGYAQVTAWPGLYRCTLEDYGGRYNDVDDDYYDDGGYCINPQRITDGMDTDVFVKDGLDLFNLQYYISSRSEDAINDNNDIKNNDDGKHYLFANTLYEHEEYSDLYSWEILRADPDENGSAADGDLPFHTYFRTVREFDWNNCDFDCCPFNDQVDSNGQQANRDYHDSAYLHSYIRTRPMSFAIDHNTGDIFISWEGFYKNCNPADMFAANQMLEWTIGVSRLKTRAEDPSCILKRKENGEPIDFSDLEVNFSRCTEPVSILFQGPKVREVLLPYGGLTVIPAASNPPSPGVKPRRTFLLSIFQVDSGKVNSHLWAMPEGGDATKNEYKRQDLIKTPVGGNFMDQNVWNGGSIKVHYNRHTGEPDHLCRSIFDQGIQCFPISVTEDVDSVYVSLTGNEETFLSSEQVNEFCTPGIETTREKREIPNFERNVKVATGLDVLWNEDDGTPQRILFGCFGADKSGKLGSVDRGGKYLTDMLPGAYSGDVLLLPRQMSTAFGIPLETSETISSKPHHNSSFSKTSSWQSFVMGLGSAIGGCLLLAMVGIALFGLSKKRSFPSFSRSSYPPTLSNNKNGVESAGRKHRNTYMELQSFSSADSRPIS